MIRSGAGLAIALAGGLALGVAVAAAPRARAGGSAPGAPAVEPVAVHAGGVAVSSVGAGACRGCHPGEHASFARTYHASMTRPAVPASLRAPFDGRPVAWPSPAADGAPRTVRLTERGGALFATLPDPDVTARAALRGERAPGAPDVERRVALVTGSHREQAFWVPGARRGELRVVPVVYLVEDGVFVPRSEAFVRPPHAPETPVRWNVGCVGCHATFGEPRHDEGADAFGTRVSDLGIACEACHGPGGAHAARFRDPFARAAAHAARARRRDDAAGDGTPRASSAPDDGLVSPRRLAPDARTAVCGQCHAYAVPRDEGVFWATGWVGTFRPGDALEPARVLLGPDELARPGGARVDAETRALFWPDGDARVGGRELHGLVGSACVTRGEGARRLDCTSCHAMHAGDPDGQLRPDRPGDAACVACHAGRDARAHTHHAEGSSGASCVACHMPRTGFALLRAVRSHRIVSPRPAARAASGKPDACTLCHLDRSARWAASWVATWSGSGGADAPGGEASATDAAIDALPAVLVDALRGDAGLRALVADAAGRAEAPAAVPRGVRARLLAELVDDPYPAVRHVARRSVRRLGGYDDVPLDLRGAAEDARLRARLLGDAVPLDDAVRGRLLDGRDDRDVTLAE